MGEAADVGRVVLWGCTRPRSTKILRVPHVDSRPTPNANLPLLAVHSAGTLLQFAVYKTWNSGWIRMH